MGMTIKQVSQAYGIPAETLRYYERVGVIPPVHRTAGGIRDYTEEDVQWVENAKCMRAAGLSVEALKQYSAWYREGDETISDRLELLQEQREQIRLQKQQLEQTLAKLDYKISRYEIAVKTGKLTWES